MNTFFQALSKLRIQQHIQMLVYCNYYTGNLTLKTKLFKQKNVICYSLSEKYLILVPPKCLIMILVLILDCKNLIFYRSINKI